MPTDSGSARLGDPLVLRGVSERLAEAWRHSDLPLAQALDELRRRAGLDQLLLLDLADDGAEPPCAVPEASAAAERWPQVAERLRPILRNGAQPRNESVREEPFQRALARESAGLGAAALRAVPLESGAGLAGILLASPADCEGIAWIEAVAPQVAALLDARRELRQMRARLSRSQVETSVLLDLSRGITSTLSLDEALASLAVVTRQLFVPDHVSIHLAGPDGRFEPASLEPGGAPPVGGATLAPDHPLAREIVGSKGPFVLLPDLSEAAHAPLARDLAERGLRSYVAAPIRSSAGVLGFLAIASRLPRHFTEFDGDLLASLAAHAATAIGNSRLFAHASEQIRKRNAEITQLADSLQQRVIELSILNELGVMVSSVLDLRGVLDLVVKSATEISGAGSAALFLRESQTGRFTVSSARGYSDEFLKRVASVSAEEGLAGEVVRTGAPLVVQDFSRETRFLYPEIESEGIRSLLAVPLVSEKQVTGLLFVSNHQPYPFSDDEQRLFSLLAGQAAVAIHNARLFEQMQRRLSELTALHDLGLAVNSVLDLDTVLDMVVRSATEITSSPSASIYLYDKQRDEFRAGAAVGLDADFLQRMSRPEESETTRAVLRDGRPLIVTDLEREPKYATDMVRQRGIRAQICFPLKAEEVIGAFYVNHFEPHQFSEDELRLFSILANQATIAIKNARLFHGLQQRVSELSAMYEVAATVSTSPDLNTVLAATVLKLSHLLDVERCRILLWNEAKGELTPQEIPGSWEPPPRERAALADSLGLAMRVLRAGETFVSNDAGNDPRILERFVDVLSIHSLVLMPVKVGNKVTGVLELANKRGGVGFDDDDLRLLSTLGSQAGSAIENARLYQDLQGSYLLTIQSLAEALDSRDTYTRGHSDRVSRISLAISRSLGLSADDAQRVYLAGVLHDIGKIGVRESVLLKPGKLTDDEFEEIKKHPIVGARILRPIPALQPLVPLILHHHERFDGKGYPSGLLGRDTPTGASIISAADAYDTMTSDRPYRKAMPLERALEELHRCTGSQFHPDVIVALDRAMGEPGWDRGTAPAAA